MNILLDTHILIWAIEDSPRLSEKARKYILDPSNDIFYSTVSVWEVALKHAIRPDSVGMSAREFAGYCRASGFYNIQVSDRHVFASEGLSRSKDAPRHNDPFDKILIGQAKSENMIFLTHDSLLPFYEERCILSV